MNRKSDNEQLLNDVFAEAADFREALLGETLHRVRRRRRLRQAQRATAGLVMLALTAVLVWQNWPKKSVIQQPFASKPVKASYQLVRTRPFPADDIVTTRSLTTSQFIASAANVEMVQTAAGNFRVINDNELLALVGQRPAALIRTGPHSEELVFVNPADAKGFPVN